MNFPFDAVRDDYSESFSPFRIGHDARILGERLRAGRSKQETPQPDVLFPVTRVGFDKTRRERVFLHRDPARP